MSKTSVKSVQNLYEQDFSLWIEDTINKLKTRDHDNLDWENLIEEVESLGKSQRKAVRSFLVRLLEHLLKRCYVPMSDCYRGWEIEIRNFRQRLQIELEDSPSLKTFLREIFAKSYEMALENVKDSYPDVYFSNLCPFPNDVDAILTNKFWEEL
ncbi:DUF29 domain-containing protein [Dolichospermum circinale CS-1225]|uniref:DUF29 domain-containing protein n=1 Tax=Dolichospermum circinale CS-537/01 TaxID=3021739 RepID=A0ABT5A0N6_9CYAN|nr:DUF29 domain-containing protein [Dolichospermum circinale]MDB9457076.1 DUF29 domain-containing protein [Dolichospermum circinale CS-545/17]MDB9467007.1 DUF29 domain-containing protein [Dolichospermum circinale CS-539/09]MDB9472326.1 DUF29 domain-containing protein [Dolichospermum circinale CS-539]MDB9485478.1 DUF29 domain-containing protein [Dolichospermum circinale CS-537/01]MDB9522788.1 DUF29 domain-containing protein [Dolichospermum circinale CS-1225]